MSRPLFLTAVALLLLAASAARAADEAGVPTGARPPEARGVNPLGGRGQVPSAAGLDDLGAPTGARPPEARGVSPLGGRGRVPPAGGLHLSSWNLEWLADAETLRKAGYWEACEMARHGRKARATLPPCDAYRRTNITEDGAYRARKLRALRDTLAGLAAQGLDVLAVQEVADRRALQAVLPRGWGVACIGEGAGVQHLAFALRKPLLAKAQCREVPLGDEHAPGQRPALALQIGGRVLLNLHLKAGCSGGPLDGTHRPACGTLQRQAQALEAWVDEQAAARRRFVLLGDFNRDLRAERRHPARHDGSDPASPIVDARRIRNLWPELDDGRTGRALRLADVERRAARAAGCLVSLDHLAVGGGEGLPAVRLVPAPADASDHCPLLATLHD